MPDDATARAVSALVFRPIGPVSVALARDVVARVSRALAVPCRLDLIAVAAAPALVPGRSQWDADLLLAAVENEASLLPSPDDDGAPVGAPVVVALAAHDMGSPLFTHFFGRSRLRGRAAVVSLARLAPEFYGLAAASDLTARRAALEVLHELGHVAGLRHCSDSGCIMLLAHHVDAIDVRGTTFCPACAAGLPRGLLRA